MVKRILWKDIRQTLSGSIGRFVSIVCLMALGSFALVGLKVAGPDMQATGAEFYGRNNLADVTVVSTYGLSEDDKDVIGRADGVRGIEYGYFKDVVIKGTDSSMRVFSKPEYISTYDVVEGRMPKRQGEIVLDLNQRSAFAVGSTLDVTEKADISGSTVLRHHRFEVVGFVRASEIVSGLNMGQSTSGSGTLTSYAVAMPSEFDSEVTMIARIVYNDTEHLNYWTDDYRDRIQKHKDQLVKLLAGQPEARESSIREQQQEKIDQARQQVKDSEQQLVDAEAQLADAKAQIASAKDQKSEGETTRCRKVPRPSHSLRRHNRRSPRPTRRSRPAKCNCSRRRRNSSKDKTGSPNHGTSFPTPNRSSMTLAPSLNSPKPCSTRPQPC